MPAAPPGDPIRVFVHLAHGFGAKEWRARWQRGEIIGVNDPLPYGYFRAKADGCAIAYSEDATEGRLGRLFRLGLRLLLGFDFVHAWRNRRAIAAAEVVWTHTESQYLAVLLLLRSRTRPQRPKIIAQSVWLFDRWPDMSWAKRRFFSWLIAAADVLTVHSPENLRRARQLFPQCRSELVAYGVRADRMIRRARRRAHRPLRVLSLGNDPHRDWATLIDAVSGWDGCELRIVSSRVRPTMICRIPNIRIVIPRKNSELMTLYDWADLAVIPLQPNLHASWITVAQEATVCGVPVICTDTGGLEAYFSPGEVGYVPVRRPRALRRRMLSLARDDDERWAMVERARRRMMSAGFTSRRFAQRHAELSHELLGRASAKGAAQPANPDAQRTGRLSSAAAALGTCLVLTTLAIGGLVAGEPGSASPIPKAGPGIDLCAFTPTFTENFDALSVSPWGKDGSRWIAHTPWAGDFGDAAFADPRPGFPFHIERGVLQIEARKNPAGKWQSGLLASAAPSTAGFAQRFGYFEMRARLPAGPGVWPAFWLNSNMPRGSKAPGVEIDAIEYYGQFPGAYHSAVHVWDKLDPSRSTVKDHIIRVPPGTLSSRFHTFGVDVEKDWIVFYRDRRETWRVETPPQLTQPLMILVNLALGSGWPIDKTPNPSIMQVDFIRAYRRLPADAAHSCPPQEAGR